MALARGYVLREAVAVDRRYPPCESGVNERLTTLGIGGLSLVRDRAKALIKVAQTGLGCRSMPDLFPLCHALAKGSSLALFGRLRPAKQILVCSRRSMWCPCPDNAIRSTP